MTASMKQIVLKKNYINLMEELSKLRVENLELKNRIGKLNIENQRLKTK